MPPIPEPPSRRPRRTLKMLRLSRDPEMRSVQIGVLGTILVHLLLFLIVPSLLRFDHSGATLPRAQPPEQFNIEIAPDAFEQTAPEKKPPPSKFVETNPDAPDNEPDKTDNFGAQNQQAAQEKESPDMSGDRPAIEGQTEIQTEQIVSGQLLPKLPPMPSAPPQEEVTPPQNAAALREQIPLTGFEKTAGDSEHAIGSNVAKFEEGSSEVKNYVKGVKDAPLVQNATETAQKVNPRMPQPRPTLANNQVRARPAIFTENKIGTSNIGPTAVDARWSNYGQYLQQLIETVQVQWDRILIQSRVYPGSGTNVSVKFVLNKKGEVQRIISVEGTAGDAGRRACVSAITDRAPYGDWTEDMVSVLGDEQAMTFTFYYQ